MRPAKTGVGLPRRLSGKKPTCQHRRYEFDPWVGKIPQRRKWQPTPVFLPEEIHGQRRLEDYSLWVAEIWRATKQHNKYQCGSEGIL